MTKVHLNLNKSNGKGGSIPGQVCWSVARKGCKIHHCHNFALENVSFHIWGNGLDKVRAKGVRAVHAWAKGDEIPVETVPADFVRICYNPFKEGKFVWQDTRESVPANLTKAIFTPTGMFARR